MKLRCAATFVALCLGCAPWWSHAQAVHTESLQIPVGAAGNEATLDSYLVRPSAQGKYPLALIVNGSLGANQVAGDVRADWLAHIAHDFASKGWLAVAVTWRGYAKSTGSMPGVGNCEAPDVAGFVGALASDLASVLDTLKRREDVDASRTLGLGYSIGGASVLALAARPQHPLSAAVNISGGVYYYADAPGVAAPDCGKFEKDLIKTVAGFGKANPTPTLWLYAENDPFFGPGLAKAMAAGYRASGGNARLMLLPPFEADGHTLYKWQASALTRPRIDDFLRDAGLPSLDRHALDPLLATLPPATRKLATEYWRGVPAEKALAMPVGPPAGLYWYHVPGSLDQARRSALRDCEAKSASKCVIAAENDRLADAWRDRQSAAPAPAQRTQGR